MFHPDIELYLPTSAETLARFQADQPCEALLRALPNHEVAALLVISHLPHLRSRGQSASSAERNLAGLIAAMKGLASGEEYDAFLARSCSLLGAEALRAGAALLAPLRIRLLGEADLEGRGFLLPDGSWDYEFHQRHSSRPPEGMREFTRADGSRGQLSDQQSRILGTVAAELEEPLDIQGYAGTGKTWLLRTLVELLESRGVPPQAILVLAQTREQAAAIREGIRGGVMPKTFGQLVAEMVPMEVIRPGYRPPREASRRHNFDAPLRFAHASGMRPVGPLPVEEVARACQELVRNYCRSADREIGRQHLPARLKGLFGTRAAACERELIQYATQLWYATLQPRDIDLPLRVYHSLKFIALGEWGLPARYSHVLLDESHDLTPALAQILDRSPQAVISFGDEYQSLHGSPARRTGGIRRRNVTHSVRAGSRIEQIVNPIIQIHPGRTKEPFVGDRNKEMSIHYYSAPPLPEPHTAILVGDEWGLFEWTARLAEAQLGFTLLGTPDLRTFVADCIELHAGGARGRHGALVRFRSWDELLRAHGRQSGFQAVAARLARRGGCLNWEQIEPYCVAAGAAPYILGRMADARNREFDRVMLTPDVLDGVWDFDNSSFYRTGSALYIGVTRVRRALLAPQALRDWIEEVSPHASA